MRKLIWVLLWVGLSGCMKVSDMADGVGYQFRDAGVLDHSRTYRVNNWHLQPDSFIYIGQAPFVPPGKAYPRPNVVAEEAFSGFIQYFPLVRRAPSPVGLEEAMAQARTAGANYLLYARFAAADDRIGTTDEWQDQEALDRLGERDIKLAHIRREQRHPERGPRPRERTRRRVLDQRFRFRFPHQLSGGEQQRVVIARALINHPKVIIADEPTGNLDPETSTEIMHLIVAVAREEKAAVIMATHDMSLIEKFPGRVYKVENRELKALDTMHRFDPFQPLFD